MVIEEHVIIIDDGLWYWPVHDYPYDDVVYVNEVYDYGYYTDHYVVDYDYDGQFYVSYQDGLLNVFVSF